VRNVTQGVNKNEPYYGLTPLCRALGGFEVGHKAWDAFKNSEAATALTTDFFEDFQAYYKDPGTPWRDFDAINIAVDVNKFTLGDLPAAYVTLDILLRP
jgi:hypothetical protein